MTAIIIGCEFCLASDYHFADRIGEACEAAREGHAAEVKWLMDRENGDRASWFEALRRQRSPLLEANTKPLAHFHC